MRVLCGDGMSNAWWIGNGPGVAHTSGVALLLSCPPFCFVLVHHYFIILLAMNAWCRVWSVRYLRLLHLKDELVELLLERLVRVVDAQLLEPVDL